MWLIVVIAQLKFNHNSLFICVSCRMQENPWPTRNHLHRFCNYPCESDVCAAFPTSSPYHRPGMPRHHLLKDAKEKKKEKRCSKSIWWKVRHGFLLVAACS